MEGPSGVELVKAAADTAIDASVGASFTAFDRTMGDWQSSLIKWRCGLSAADRARFGARPGWNCHDLKFFVGRLGFDQLDPARAAELETIPTRFRLPPDQVDSVIIRRPRCLAGEPDVPRLRRQPVGPPRPAPSSPSPVISPIWRRAGVALPAGCHGDGPGAIRLLRGEKYASPGWTIRLGLRHRQRVGPRISRYR